MNHVVLLGRLGRDPELKYTPSGTAVCNLSLASDEAWKDKDGNKHKKTDWHRLTAWGRQAEVMAEYLKKGSQVLVAGKIETREYEKDGKKNYITEIKVSLFEFVGGKADKPEPVNTDVNTDDDAPF
jgi:single-strand DNA-binding protein